MGYGWLNLGSLALGILAWALPAMGISRRAYRGRRLAASILGSVGACAASLSLQILYSGHLVRIGDWSALMDTMDAVAFAALVLIGVTLLLNAAQVFLGGREE